MTRSRKLAVLALLPSGLLFAPRASHGAWAREEIVRARDFSGADSALAPDGSPAIAWSVVPSSSSYGEGVYFAELEPSGYRIEVVAEGCVGGPFSLAYDRGGEPAISYIDHAARDLRLARRSGSIWTSEIVTALGEESSLAFDASGSPLIAYITGGSVALARRGGATWQTAIVDTPAAGEVYQGVRLALNAAGEAFIAYQAKNAMDVRLARSSGGPWVAETVDSTGFLGQALDLALDSLGRPVLAYSDNPSGGRLARLDGSTWSYEAVPTATSWGKCALALDARDHPAIATLTFGRGDLACARSDGISWTFTTVQAGTGADDALGLVLDPAELPAISYYERPGASIKQARGDGTGYQIETIDRARYSRGASIAFDPAGNLLAAFRDSNPLGLHFGRHSGGTWEFVTVDGQRLPSDISLALDALGNPAISYAEDPGNKLRFAWWDGAGWQNEEVPGAVPRRDYGTDLAFDPAGDPVIAYSTMTSPAMVEIATRSAGVWSIRSVGKGADASLAFDPGGAPALTFVRYGVSSGFDDLRFSRWDGTAWRETSVESSSWANVGQGSDLVFDSTGVATVSYHFADVNDLKLARQVGTVWVPQVVDSTASVSPSGTSLVYDSGGAPHILYTATPGSAGTRAWHATWNGAAWTREELTGTGVTYADSLAIDGADNLAAALRHESSCPSALPGFWIAHRSDVAAKLHRGKVASLAPGWKAAALPLTDLNDDATGGFPRAAVTPGIDSDFTPPAVPLVLYRVITSSGAPLTRPLKIAKAGNGVTMEM